VLLEKDSVAQVAKEEEQYYANNNCGCGMIVSGLCLFSLCLFIGFLMFFR